MAPILRGARRYDFAPAAATNRSPLCAVHHTQLCRLASTSAPRRGFTAVMAFTALLPALTYHATSPEGFSPPFLLARLLESAGATWDPSAGPSAIAYGLGALLTGFAAVAILVGKLPLLQVRGGVSRAHGVLQGVLKGAWKVLGRMVVFIGCALWTPLAWLSPVAADSSAASCLSSNCSLHHASLAVLLAVVLATIVHLLLFSAFSHWHHHCIATLLLNLFGAKSPSTTTPDRLPALTKCCLWRHAGAQAGGPAGRAGLPTAQAAGCGAAAGMRGALHTQGGRVLQSSAHKKGCDVYLGVLFPKVWLVRDVLFKKWCALQQGGNNGGEASRSKPAVL
jgi:hypothetical protein